MTTTTACPTRDTLARLADDVLAANDEPAVLAHLEQCKLCQQELESLAGGAATWDAIAQHLHASESASNAPPKLAAAIAALKAQSLPGHAPVLADVSPDLPPNFLQPPREAGHLGRIEHYEVIEELGRGAMGIVLRAFDEQLHRMVALKVMSPQLAGHATSRQRFKREGRAAAGVCHEHVVTIHSVDESAGLPYLVMQYVSGVSLQQRLDCTGPLQVPEILRIGLQAAAGLAAAHQQGLVHRDIKPANLLLENGVERVKITDFGLARAVDDASLTQSGVISGTPQYMAPEQARGETLDARADLFSLGCVLYALCTGRPPFRGSSTMAVLKRICEDQPKPIRELNPEIPDWLAAIIERLLAKNPADRFQSAQELSTLLSQCLAHVQQPGRVPPPLVVLPAATALVQSPEASRRVWLRTPAGIAVLLLAVVLPIIAVAAIAGIGVLAYWLDNDTIGRWLNGKLPLASSEPLPIDERYRLPQAERPHEPPAAVTVSVAELKELERLVSIAQQEVSIAKQRYESGQTTNSERLTAEVNLVQAKVRLARASQQPQRVVELLQEQVALCEQLLAQADARLKALIATPSERLAAEKVLSEARLELRAAEAAAPPP